MRKLNLIWLLLIAGCATNVPVSVPCPPLPVPPQSLTQPVQAGPTFSERSDALMMQLQETYRQRVRELLQSLNPPTTTP